MDTNQVKEIKRQAQQITSVNWEPIMAALIQAEALRRFGTRIEEASKRIESGLDHIGRRV